MTGLEMILAEDEWVRSALYCIQMREWKDNNTFPGIDDLMIEQGETMSKKCDYCDNESIGYLYDSPVGFNYPRTIPFCADHQKQACEEVANTEQYESVTPLFVLHLSDDVIPTIEFGGRERS